MACFTFVYGLKEEIEPKIRLKLLAREQVVELESEEEGEIVCVGQRKRRATDSVIEVVDLVRLCFPLLSRLIINV